MRKTRRFVLSCLAGAPGLALVLHSGVGFGAGDSGEPSAATLRRLVDDPRRARVLGASYRARFPAEDHPDVLSGLVRASLGLGSRGALPGHAALRAAVDARVRAEFGAGDIVHVDGWVLSRTEARLCALCE